ncbi:egg cell-secreted protein 1.1-like [Malania oleifera]|uniref:egg cell-secreted protein 1.1-like n=1 Tax=Malania oleifera TaxID=397392 RepID=UPI0025ADB0A9|nr:egg cell-secreted protein 1.1-like [Malania oleifera]
MASSSPNFLLVALVLLACCAAASLATRPLNLESSSVAPLAPRLMQVDGNNNSYPGDNSNNYCRDSLFELHSCVGEVILFFLNGEAYLGPTCCRAIHAVQLHC